MKHKFITIGEIMLRLTPPDYEKIRTATTFEARYGGSEANVALSLANLGIDASFFTVVPDNSLGKSAVRMMRSNDVNCDSVVYSTEHLLMPKIIGTLLVIMLAVIVLVEGRERKAATGKFFGSFGPFFRENADFKKDRKSVV